MSRALVFFLGLIALGLLTFFCVRNKIPLIKADLAERTTTALAEKSFQFAKVEVNGRDITLTGVAPDVDARKLAADEAMAVFGVTSVDNRLRISEPAVSPIASPYRTELLCSEDSIVLKGVVPDDESRSWLVGVMGDKFGRDKLTDELRIAGGSPENWRSAMKSIIDRVGVFDEVEIELVDTKINVNGRVKEPENQTKVQEDVAADMPSNFHVSYDINTHSTEKSDSEVKTDDKPEVAVIQEPKPVIEEVLETKDVDEPAPPTKEQPKKPYQTHIVLENDTVVLSGFVPDKEAQSQIVKAFTSEFGEGNLKEKLEIASGAPEGWQKMMHALPATLHRFAAGDISITDTGMQVKGNVFTDDAKTAIEKDITGFLPDGFSQPEVDISVDKTGFVAHCQKRINEALTGTKVLFNTASARIQKTSYGILDQLSGIFKECPEMSVEVGGHTDSRGDEHQNLTLSSNRASSVVAYLVKKGLSEDIFQSVGYGEARPVADNKTPEGRAKNRRIEFKVGRK